MLKSLSLSLALTSTIALSAGFKFHKAEQPSKTERLFLCPDGPRAMRLSLRHIEGGGIGYNKGYSTLEGFFTPIDLWKNHYIPFLDLRAHLFNNGKWAGNAGIGLRFLTSSRVWGMNGYYDYRKTEHEHYNQISAGFESLGRVWDFRVNGYLPIGAKTSPYFNTEFQRFEGNSIIVRRKREFAMKGANAEAGIHLNSSRNFPLYFAFGPYYLEGKGKVAWGGEGRLRLSLSDYLMLEGNTSYDKIFKWIGQAQVGLNFPFGGRRKVKQRKEHTCKEELMLATRLEQRVDRFEIIPVHNQHVEQTATLLGTQEPLNLIFVDNTSSSDGTFESPFSTLATAQNNSKPNDIIIVLPGDGTSTGLDKGIVLQNGQKLLGAHLSYRLATAQGTIVLPALASSAPLLTNTNNFAQVIASAAHNEIAGLQIKSTTGISSGGILVQGPDIYIHDNILTTGNLNNAITIQSGDCGVALISNNAFYSSDATDVYGIFVSSSAGELSILHNLFTGTTTLSGFDTGVNILAGTSTNIPNTLNIAINSNTFNSQTNTANDLPCAINITNSLAGQQINGSILGNVIDIPAGISMPVGGLYVVEELDAGIMRLAVKDNVATTIMPTPGYNFINNASPSYLILDFQNNVGTRVGP